MFCDGQFRVRPPSTPTTPGPSDRYRPGRPGGQQARRSGDLRGPGARWLGGPGKPRRRETRDVPRPAGPRAAGCGLGRLGGGGWGLVVQDPGPGGGPPDHQTPDYRDSDLPGFRATRPRGHPDSESRASGPPGYPDLRAARPRGYGRQAGASTGHQAAGPRNLPVLQACGPPDPGLPELGTSQVTGPPDLRAERPESAGHQAPGYWPPGLGTPQVSEPSDLSASRQRTCGPARHRAARPPGPGGAGRQGRGRGRPSGPGAGRPGGEGPRGGGQGAGFRAGSESAGPLPGAPQGHISDLSG